MGEIDMSTKQSRLKQFLVFFKARPIYQRLVIALGIFIVAGFAIQFVNVLLIRAISSSPLSPDKLGAQIESIVTSAAATVPEVTSEDATAAAGNNSVVAAAFNELLSRGQWKAENGAEMTAGQMLIAESNKSKSVNTAYSIESVTQDDDGYRAVIVYETHGIDKPAHAMLSVSLRDDDSYQLASDAFALSQTYTRLPD
jgi:hypothetical protein